MLSYLLSCINNPLLYMQKRYQSTSIGFFWARVVNLQPVTIMREIIFKQQDNKEAWVNQIEVNNLSSEYQGVVEYKTRNILKPIMKCHSWTMLLKVEFDHMNVDNVLCVKVEVLLWNKVDA